MTIVWETQIRTGHPVGDQQMLDQVRRQYEPQGMQVQVQPMPGGGFHVRVVRPQVSYRPQQQMMPPRMYGAPMPGGFAYAGGQPQGQGAPATTYLSEGEERVRYLRKVYGLLAIGVVFAIAAGWVSTSPLLGTETFKLEHGHRIEVPILVALMLDNPALRYGTFGVLVVGVFIASLVSKVKGLNYAALFGVSALMGFQLAPMVFVAQVLAGMGETLSGNPVRDAGAMVGAIFIALTTYVFIARKDFSYLWATLSMGFVVVLVACVLAAVVGSEPFSLAVASAGALLSIGFLLYQTSWIFRNSDMDDPVDDALGLIVQLRNLFMFLLRIFMSRR
jgi:FtsH-binding integral membrane protein